MLNLKKLTDVEVAFMTYAFEQTHDSMRDDVQDEEKIKPLLDVAEELRELLTTEYESRKLCSDTWGL